jgi:hypothetical protein
MAGKIWTEILTVHVGTFAPTGLARCGSIPHQSVKRRGLPIEKQPSEVQNSAASADFVAAADAADVFAAFNQGAWFKDKLAWWIKSSFGSYTECSMPFTTIVIAVGVFAYLRYFSAMIVGCHVWMFPIAAVVMCDQFSSQQTDVLALQSSYRFVFKNLGSWRVKFVERHPRGHLKQTDDGQVGLTCNRAQARSTKLSTTRFSPALSNRMVSLLPSTSKMSP